MNIIYDKATLDDAYGIAYVSAHSWKETYTNLLPDEYLDNRIKNIEESSERTKKFLTNFDGEYIVAKDKDSVIGILAYNVKDDIGHIEAIYVLKDYQGYGIGKQLFKIAVKDFVEQNINEMDLACMTGNPTLSFYQKYKGYIVEQIDYPINGVGTVKADIIKFDNLTEILELLNKKMRMK